MDMHGHGAPFPIHRESLDCLVRSLLRSPYSTSDALLIMADALVDAAADPAIDAAGPDLRKTAAALRDIAPWYATRPRVPMADRVGPVRALLQMFPMTAERLLARYRNAPVDDPFRALLAELHQGAVQLEAEQRATRDAHP